MRRGGPKSSGNSGGTDSGNTNNANNSNSAPQDATIYKATYSGVPVYEFLAKGIACMRRRSDGWLNATQILKVADFDKPQRTRILEREVQRGLHEKVQGGYGKYQGTWVPLERGREIAVLYNVEGVLRPIFDFRPSEESPPLAPKHVTAASAKPRPARGGGGGRGGNAAANAQAASQSSAGGQSAHAPSRRALKPTPQAPPSVDSADEGEEIEEEEEEEVEEVEDGDITSDIETFMSSPVQEPSPIGGDEFSDGEQELEEEDVLETLPYHKEVGGTLGRKRKHMTMVDGDDYGHHGHHGQHHHHQQHNHYGTSQHHNHNQHFHHSSSNHHHGNSHHNHHHHQQQQYLNHHNQHHHIERRRQQAYSDELLDYFMSSGGGDLPSFLTSPPPDFNVNEIIDDEAHTAFHWAAAMGDLRVLELLLRAGADIAQPNSRGETPLMRAVLFTNNYDRKSFPRLVELLRATIPLRDKFNSSVFHHIAATTLSRNKCIAARYYADVLLQKMAEIHPMQEIAKTLNQQDTDGDTALTIAARNGAKKLIRSLLAYNTNPHIPNHQGQTADELIVEVEKRKLYAQQQQQGVYGSSYVPPQGSSSPYQPHQSLPRDHRYRPSSPGVSTVAPYSYHQQSEVPPSHYQPTAPYNSTSNPYPTHQYHNHHPLVLPQPHISEAAIRATQKAIPDIAEKLEALAKAFDAELEEKEKDLKQARTLLEDTERDMGVLVEMYRDVEKGVLAAHATEAGNALGGTISGVEVLSKEIEKLKIEEMELCVELRRAVEARQAVELRRLAEEVEREVEREVGAETVKPEDGQEDENLLLEGKFKAMKELVRLQRERREMVDKIIGLYARCSGDNSFVDGNHHHRSQIQAQSNANFNSAENSSLAPPAIANPNPTNTSFNSLLSTDRPNPPPPPNRATNNTATDRETHPPPPHTPTKPTAPTTTATRPPISPSHASHPIQSTSSTSRHGNAAPPPSRENKIAIYRRLIANSVGLEMDQVEEILPELLRSLEGSGRAAVEGGAVGGTGGSGSTAGPVGLGLSVGVSVGVGVGR